MPGAGMSPEQKARRRARIARVVESKRKPSPMEPLKLSTTYWVTKNSLGTIDVWLVPPVFCFHEEGCYWKLPDPELQVVLNFEPRSAYWGYWSQADAMKNISSHVLPDTDRECIRVGGDQGILPVVQTLSGS